MLGTEPQILADYVETGQVTGVFWPVLNHGNPSVYATLTAVCVGRQDPQLFWDMHHYLFQNQSELWAADRDYYIEAAAGIGADEAAFTACYDGPDGIAEVTALDALRRERGIYSQPTFVVNDTLFAGAAAYETFAELFDSLAPP